MSLTIPVAEIINNSTNPLLAIDPSWERVPLGRVAKILNGYAFKSELFNDKKGTPLIRIRDIENIKTECYYDGAFDEAYVIHPGDLLVGMDGNFNCSTWRGPKALLNQRVCKIEVKTEQYDRKFLEYVLPGYLSAINENTSSQTVKHLSSRSISEILLPNPPLAEQQRIVARVEALLTQVNVARDRLNRVPLIMKKFRQAVLAAACSGRLTEGWREENPDIKSLENPIKVSLVNEQGTHKKGKKNEEIAEPIGSEKISEFNIPDVWEITTLGQLFFIRSGEAFKKSDYTPTGYKLFQIANVSFGKTLWEQQNYLPQKFAHEYPDLVLKKDDICIALNRPILGDNLKVTKISETDLPAILYQRVGCLRAKYNYITNYIFYYLLSDTFREVVRENLQGTDQPYLNFSLLQNMAIPLPPLAEQHEIVRRVNALFTRADAIDREVAAASKRAEALTQAVLARGFAGKLL